MIANLKEVKTVTKHISCNFKCNVNSTACNSNQNRITKRVNVSINIIIYAKKITVGILAHVFVENNKHLKSVATTSACDEIISVMDIVSKEVTNTIGTNVLISSNDKQIRYEMKGTLSGLRQFLAIENPLKMMKNAF